MASIDSLPSLLLLDYLFILIIWDSMLVHLCHDPPRACADYPWSIRWYSEGHHEANCDWFGLSSSGAFLIADAAMEPLQWRGFYHSSHERVTSRHRGGHRNLPDTCQRDKSCDSCIDWTTACRRAAGKFIQQSRATPSYSWNILHLLYIIIIKFLIDTLLV